MNRRLLIVLSAIFFAGAAGAESPPGPTAGTPLPAEWEGIWTSVDTIYFCPPSTSIKVISRTDTLCAGEEIGQDPNAHNPFSFLICSGAADATHIQTSCVSDGPSGPNCQLTYSTDADATRAGDTAFWIWTTRFTFMGNCEVPSSCGVTHSHATRTRPGPLAACGAVPTKPSTWGDLKARYR